MSHLAHLQQCMQSGRFALWAQHIWSLDESACLGTEIFLRVPSNEDLVPSFSAVEWINLAEENKFLDVLTLEILGKISSSSELFENRDNFPYYINTSLPVLTPTFAVDFLSIIAKNKLSPSQFGIELTERQPIENLSLFKQSIDLLRSNGVFVALDDYGAGYSTIDILDHIQIDRIKIDHSLLKSAQNNEEEYVALLGTLNLIKQKDIVIIAEGVETKTDLDFARLIGCIGVQGYFFDYPKLLLDY